ncbi:MAG TPA: tetratricopeptide repeat protein [Candidatus Acidoferrales bacterium]
MAFNKSKALENALKFLNQGKVAQAIGEYQLILRNDPKDQATLMTVGDLFARQGDMPQAVEYFERLAHVYLNDGFNSKAIAIYKKIAKLAPNELAPLERLADLYVQQGVLSEARPLFLQIAEAHLKANHSQKAVEVLHRLLEVEPENQRVQMRLAELYGMMGQKQEAAQTYLGYAQRLFERGETDEADKLVDRAIEVDPSNSEAILLKSKTLAAASKFDAAIATLSHHPEAQAGGDVTELLVDYELRAGHSAQAAERARQQLAKGHQHFTLLYGVVEAMIEGGDAANALPLLTELRAPMVEAGAQDNFVKSLTTLCEKMPGQCEPLEMLVDFCRHASEPFRLNAALGQLSDACAAKDNVARAEELLVELVDRNKNDERLVERLNQFRARTGTAPIPAAPVETQIGAAALDAPVAAPVVAAIPEPVDDRPVNLTPVVTPVIVEETLDEDTQRYIAQALTDVDLFSSYGLTQKATHLLENVLQRAPRHTPTLERLLDLHLGAGNDRRTAELSAQLEQIHRERNDHVNADRFGELRRRYSKVAGLSESDLPPAPAMVAPVAGAPAVEPAPAAGAWSHEANPQIGAPVVAPEPVASAVATPAPPAVPAQAPAPPQAAVEPPPFEIEIESVPVPEVHATAPAVEPAEFEIPLMALDASGPEPQQISPEGTFGEAAAAPAAESAAASGELDLSDEWAAISDEAEAIPVDAQPAPEAAEIVAPLEFDPIVEPEPASAVPQHSAAPSEDETIAEIRRAANEAVAQMSSDGEVIDEEPDHATGVKPFEIDSNLAQTDLTDDVFAAPPAETVQVAEPEIHAAAEIELDPVVTPAAEIEAEPVFEIVEEPVAEVGSPAANLPADLLDFLNEPVPEIAEAPEVAPEVGAEAIAEAVEAAPEPELEIELTPEPALTQKNGDSKTTDDFLSELAAEFDDLEAPTPEPVHAASNQRPTAAPPQEIHSQLQGVFAEAPIAPQASSATAPPPATGSIENFNELAEVFQEFRSELGEMNDEDEDLETHYNLGIAYREMGLLDEAIGEFQKVAKAIQKGKPFRYEMNCSTMLGLSFMDKGEPMVASLWYKRALTTPHLEEESILALQYDLGLALESAGEADAALDSFRQVYAANIDYRDVADRIATLQKQ